MAREIGDRHDEGRALANFGAAYEGLEQVERAIEYLESALRIFVEIGSPYTDAVRSQLEELRKQAAS
jgi:hypothetical protein